MDTDPGQSVSGAEEADPGKETPATGSATTPETPRKFHRKGKRRLSEQQGEQRAIASVLADFLRSTDTEAKDTRQKVRCCTHSMSLV